MAGTMIDLRSDTVTKPTAAMRAAMASAEVGDDVYGEDPTVNKLEERAAAIFGREAAIFVPTGSMGNVIAARLHTEHGQEVICESQAHILDWEMGMVSAYAGCVPRTVLGDGGILAWDKIKSAISPKIYYRAQTGLIWLENTANIAGGIVTPLPVLEEVWAGAKEAGLPTHLDGARIFNAAVALGVHVAELTSGFDTVMFCLSKGLGAPVGSMLVGSMKNIARARVFRKALGGGMRQAGILAAAGLIALEEMPSRLHEDHANARLLAEAISRCDAAEIDLERVQTNIIIFKLKATKEGSDAAPAFVAALKNEGVIGSAIGPNTVRLVTHFDVSRQDCERAAETIAEALQGVAV
jgi:threonine aldolase